MLTPLEMSFPAADGLVQGAAHAMAIYFDIRDELLDFPRKVLGVA
jgi:hypothetical protein